MQKKANMTQMEQAMLMCISNKWEAKTFATLPYLTEKELLGAW